MRLLFYYYTLILSISAVIYEIDQITAVQRIVVNWNEQNLLIGSFSKYAPLNNFQNVGEISRSETNSQLIYAGLDLENQSTWLLHFVEFNEQNKQIKHVIKIMTLSQQIQEEFLVDISHYEGNWIFQYMYFNEQQLIIGIKQQSGYQQKSISTNQFGKNQFLLILGGSLKIIDQIPNQTLLLSSFPGILGFFLEEDISIFDDKIFQEKCFPSSNDQIQDYFYNEGSTYKEFESENEYVNSFFLQFWLKIIPSKQPLNYILRMSINKSSNFIGQIGSNSFILNYEYLQEDLIYYIEYYSYDFPIINQAIEDPFKQFVQESISIQFITEWHLIQVIYLEKQLNVQIENFILKEKKIQIFENVNQFTNTKMKIYFGGNQYEKNENRLEIGSVIFKNCLDNNNQIQYCHYTCQTCYGPFRSQCLSCFDYQNRIYDPIKKNCNCQMWYYENQTNHICMGQEQNQYLETKEYLKNDPSYDENEEVKTCAFGYFPYKDECIQCPSASQKGFVTCSNCLINHDTWIYQDYCRNTYFGQPGIENAVYNIGNLMKHDPQILFILIDNELTSCGDCIQCDGIDERCFLYPFKHLDQPFYIQCRNGYDAETFKCKFNDRPYYYKVCEENCGQCDFSGYCNYCINPTEYFFTWERKCRVCKVKNCKYCFQYNRYDHSQISVNSDIAQVLISQNEEDYIMACALCYQGYAFNFQINECVLQQVTSTCLNGYIDENLQFVCTNSLGIFNQQENNNVSQFHDCLKYFSKCVSCVQDSFKMIYCIQCEDGYYLDYHNGLCFSCSEIFKNTKRCSIETSSYDSWKYDLISFYLNFIPNSLPIQLHGYYYMTNYLILECNEGFLMPNQRTCTPKLENRCVLWDDDGSCAKCQNFDEENDAQSFFDDRCQICPYPCRFCVPISNSTINQLNPYFIINENTKAQTYKCLLNQEQNLSFIHQKYGQIMPKDSNNNKYLRKIQSPKFPDSPISNAQNYIDFEYLKRRKVTTYVDNYNAFREEDPINLRQVLFFIFNSTVLYDGFNDTFHEKQISIINQTTVNIQNVRYFSQKNQIIISSLLGVSIYIQNITLQNLIRESPILTITNFTHLFISKLEAYDITLYNTSLFSLNKNYNQNKVYPLVIQEIYLKNCIFQNSSFIYLSTKFGQIDQFKINKIICDNCTFENSQFINFGEEFIVLNTFLLEDLKIINSNFINSQLISLQNSNFSLFNGIHIQNCKLNLTTLISLSTYSTLKKIDFNNITLDNSMFFTYTETIKSECIHKIDDINMESILIYGSNPIKISQNLYDTSSIEVKNIILNQIELSYQFQYDLKEKRTFFCLFDFQSNKIDIVQLRNDQINNYWILCINNSNIINIDDVHLNYYKKLSYDPNKNYSKLNIDRLNSGFLYIKQLLTANFSNIIIRSQNLIDSSMIYINSKNEQQIKNQSLIFSNVVFENNLLIKIQSFSITTLLYLEFEGKCVITISNITFISNYVIHQIQDHFTISPSLIYILTQSFTQLKNVKFNQNDNINSYFPSLYIKSSEIYFEQINAQSINIFDFDLSEYLSENNIFNYGGFSYLYGSQITIINSKFENALAQLTTYFYVYLQDEGNMIINDTSISGIIVSTTKQDNNQNGAAFVIDATNSNINFEMNNIQISNVLSRYSTGFFKINPSKNKNLLRFHNITVNNVLSKHQHFLDLTCTNNIDNSVEIADFSLTLDKDFFKKYHSFIDIKDNINSLTQIDIQGMIVITNSSIILQRLHFSGYAPITILCLQDNPKIVINNLVMEQIEVATLKLNIINHQYSGNQLKIITMYLCQLVIKHTYNEIYTNVESFFEILQNFPKRLILKDILITNNTCTTCKNGLIYLKQIEKFLLQNSIFYQNQCGLQTCLMLNQVNQSLILKNNKFIRNSGTQGGAINIKANKIQMKNIMFMLNDAKNGGALYQSSYTMKLEILIVDLYLIKNTANIGGAIYLENHNYKSEQLLNVYFLENQGYKYIDNIRENPIQLKLSIFNQELDTKSKSNIGSPNFEKYKLKTNVIYIPSGQQINNYSIQDIERQVFNIYNLNPKIYAINNLGEKQINLQQYQCILKYQNQQDELLLNQEYIIPFIQESQSFDFSNLIISLDPYIKNETIFIFDCDCFTESQYKFYFSVKSFPCQIGEFYYFNQCMKCEESKGFYSVEPRATFCQKIDPNIIQANTASEIQLQPGYWRANYRNKFINKCIRQKTLCMGGWKPGDQSCSLGYIGALCEECDIYNIKGDGQYYKNKNNKCVFCSEHGYSIFISLLFGLLTIGSMILTVSSVNTIFKSFLKLKLTSKYYKILFNHSLDQSAALIKTVVNYIQILVRIQSFQLELYYNIIDILTPLSNPIGTQSYTYQCFLSQQTELHIIYISLIINLLAPIFFYLIFLTVYLLLIYKKKLKLTPTIYATAIFYLFFYTQPNIILELGELITSRNISEIQYINRNVSILYFTSTHISWALFFITPVLFITGIIIPLILFLILYKKRSYFNQEKVRKIWGYIFNDYKESSFYWEIFRVSEREIILLSLIIFEEQIEIKGTLTFLILFLYHIIVQKKKPFNMETLNRFEQKCITLSGLIFLICGIKYQVQLLQITSIDFILQTLLLIVFIIFFYILISQTIQTYYQKYTDRLDGIRKFLLIKYPNIVKICPFLKNYLKLRVDIQIKLKARVKYIKEALHMCKGDNMMQSQHHNLLSFSLQKSNYFEEQPSNFQNPQSFLKNNNEKEKSPFARDLVPHY